MIRRRRFAASARPARRWMLWRGACQPREVIAAAAAVTRAALQLLLCSVPAFAQPATPGPPLQLADLQQAAIASDPRTRELTLLESQSSLRQANLSRQWYPSTSVESLVQYQTDAPTTPLLTADSKPFFSAPKDNYDVYGRIEQRLWDPGVGAQSAVERAQLAEQQARVRTAVFAVRQQVNDAFFAAATLQQRLNVVTATITELEGRLREANARVQEGTAVRSDAGAVEATLLQRQQDADELRANMRGALARLATIVGRPIPTDAVPAVPDLAVQFSRVRDQLQTLRLRPEYEQFAKTRDRIATQQEVTGAQSQPKVTAFGRVGFGRPALDFIQNEWEAYGVGGVRLQWNAWNWGTTGREREAQQLQSDITSAEEAAFAKGVAAAVEGDLATIEHLARALETDQRIIDLRADVERTARVRLQEGVLTSSDYLARDTELLQARIAQATHQVELAQARARVLTTIGAEVR
jgi:outer membrane protein TolC